MSSAAASEFANIPNNLGINMNGISTPIASMLRGALEGAIAANEDNIQAFARTVASTGPIQRRGSSMPGDVGQNFGLHNSQYFGGTGYSPYSDFFGSREIGGGGFHGHGYGFFGGFGGIGGIAGLGGFGQGSFTGFSRNTCLAHHKMAAAVSAYKGFGIIKNVIDLMANFASEGLTIKHKRKNIEKFYQRWAEHVGLQERVSAILRYYYKYSNVFIYTTMGTIDAATYDKMKRAKAGRDGRISGFNKIARVLGNTNDPENNKRRKRAIKESKKPVGQREIPWRYQLLNPFQMEKIGTEFFGESEWTFIMDPETASAVSRGKLKDKYNHINFLDDTETNLPPDFKAAIQSSTDKRVVKLDQTKLTTLFYMKDDHEDWADPMIWPVMNDIFFKNKLRQMDISVANSVINSITIFKLGDWKNGFVPPKEHFRKFSEFLRAPTAAMTMVWNDAVDVVSNHPPVDRILGMSKYESVDRDILRGLGVPDTLIGGASNSNFSTGFLGVRTLLERLEEGRNAVLRWLNAQLRLIADTMGHRDIPTVKFGKMSLRDEKAEKQLIMGLLDRNIISIQAVLEYFGEDFEIETERLKEEKRLSEEEDIFVKHSPFKDPMATMTDEEMMDREEERADKEAERAIKQRQSERRAQIKLQRQAPKNINGRPPNTEDVPQENKRETKPKGMASIIDYESSKARALEELNKVYEIVADEIVALRNKTYKKELSAIDKKAIEDITFVVVANINDSFPLSASKIRSVLDKNRILPQSVANTYEKLKNDSMNIRDRRRAMASAVAVYRMGVK